MMMVDRIVFAFGICAVSCEFAVTGRGAVLVEHHFIQDVRIVKVYKVVSLEAGRGVHGWRLIVGQACL